jgi:hypothetical protein
MDPFLLILLGGGGLGLILILLGLIVPAFGYLAMAVGYMMSIVGGVWFLIIAFQDDVMSGILCLICGIYSLYYLVTHFEEEKQPFFLQLVGMGIIIGSGVTGAAHLLGPL